VKLLIASNVAGLFIKSKNQNLKWSEITPLYFFNIEKTVVSLNLKYILKYGKKIALRYCNFSQILV